MVYVLVMKWEDMRPGDVWWTGKQSKVTSQIAGWMLISIVEEKLHVTLDTTDDKPVIRPLNITHIEVFGPHAGMIRSVQVFSDMKVPGYLMLVPRD